MRDRRKMLPTVSLCAVLAAASAQADWLQLGPDINGEAAGDQSGCAIDLSADGSRLAVGAFVNAGGGTEAGHVRLFDWSGSAWLQAGSDIDGEAAYDRSGLAVTLSADGSRVAVGAFFNDGGGNRSGQVRVFGWSGTDWVQVGTDIDGQGEEDRAGWSVALSADGGRVAIGAPWCNGSADGSGRVRVFDWSGLAWVQAGGDIDGEAAWDGSGWAVALSATGDRLAVGAPANDGGGIDSGHVRVYEWSGTAWEPLGPDMDGSGGDDAAGRAVALSADGSRVAVGAGLSGWRSPTIGHARVFDWNGSTWVQAGSEIPGEAPGDEAGCSVDLSHRGNRLAVGARFNDGAGLDAGHTRIFDWNGSDWAQAGADIDGEGEYENAGCAVALSADGGRVAIGACLNNDIGLYAGQTRVYDDGSPGPTPTGLPSATPTAWPTEVPTATPEPCGEFGVIVTSSDHHVSPGEEFWVRAELCNPDAFVADAPFVAMLDLGTGEYWFYPSWARYPPGFDHQAIDLPTGITPVPVVPAFHWPDTGADAMAGIRIYGAVLTPDLAAVRGELGWVEFGFGP